MLRLEHFNKKSGEGIFIGIFLKWSKWIKILFAYYVYYRIMVPEICILKKCQTPWHIPKFVEYGA